MGVWSVAGAGMNNPLKIQHLTRLPQRSSSRPCIQHAMERSDAKGAGLFVALSIKTTNPARLPESKIGIIRRQMGMARALHAERSTLELMVYD